MIGRVFLLVVILLLAVMACQSPAPAPDEATAQTDMSPADAVAEVRQVFEDYVSNWNAANIEGVLAVVADDAVQMGPDWVYVGKEALSAEWRDFLGQNSDTWEPTIDEIQAAGDLVFIKLHSTETWTPKAGGEATTMVGRGVSVFQREISGEWKLVLEQFFEEKPST